MNVEGLWKTERQKAIFALVIAVVAISFAAILFRKAAPTHPLAASAIRLGFASLLFSPFIIKAAKKGRLNRRIIFWAMLAGVLYAIHFGAWVTSLFHTSIAASVTLVTTNPLILAFISVLTGKDRPTKPLWFALGIAAVGMGIIGFHSPGGGGSLFGDSLAFLGAVAMSFYLLVVRHLGKALDAFAFSAIATGVGALLLFFVGMLFGVDMRPVGFSAVGYLLLAALLPQMVGHALLTWILRRYTPTSVAFAIVAEPVGATALGWFILGESVTWGIITGCAVTLAAVVLAIIAGDGRLRRS